MMKANVEKKNSKAGFKPCLSGEQSTLGRRYH